MGMCLLSLALLRVDATSKGACFIMNKKSLRELYPKRIDIVILIAASAMLLFIGFRLPVFTVRKLWESNTFSIISGIMALWKDKYVFLASVIFFFSAVFPVVKLASLSFIWFVRMTDEQRKRLLYYLSILGKWSILDVFVASIIIVAVKLGVLASAKVEKGIYFFGMSILLAMIVTTLEYNLTHRSRTSNTAS